MALLIKMILIYSTFPNVKEAKRIVESLVRERLAACCNVFPIEAIYSWQGKIAKDKEVAAIIKSKKANFKKVEQFILKHHPYDNPCILEISVGRVTKKYLQWLNKI